MIGLEYVLKLFEMTQQELADKLEIKQQNIDSWIKGKRNIPKKWLPILAEIFNIPEKYFQKELIGNDKEKIQFMKLYNTNSEEELGYLIEISKENEKEESKEENESMENWKADLLKEFNAERQVLLNMINEIIDLKFDNTSYSAKVCIALMADKYSYITLIKRFLVILSNIKNPLLNIDMQLLDDIFAGFELFKGEELLDEDNNQDKIKNYEDRLKFINKMKKLIEKEGKRIISES